MKPNVLNRFQITQLLAAACITSSAYAASGTWDNDAATQNWQDVTNWNPDGAVGLTTDVYTSTDAATFSATGSGTINLGDRINIQNINFGSGAGDANAFIIGDANDTLNLTSAGVALMGTGVTTTQQIGLAGTTIKLANTTNSTYTFTNNSGTTAAKLDIAGNISKLTGTGASTVTLNGTNGGTVSGNITDGGGSSILALTTSGLGTWTLTGTNGYTGMTSITAGTLQLGNGGTTGNLGTGNISVAGGTLAISRSNTATVNGGTLALNGGSIQNLGANATTMARASTGGTAVSFTGTNTLSAASGGSLGITGTGTNNNSIGLNFAASTTLNSTGAVTLTGASTGSTLSTRAIRFNGNVTINNNSSDASLLTIKSNETPLNGVAFFQNNAGTITTTGKVMFDVTSFAGGSIAYRTIAATALSFAATNGTLTLNSNVPTSATGNEVSFSLSSTAGANFVASSGATINVTGLPINVTAGVSNTISSGGGALNIGSNIRTSAANAAATTVALTTAGGHSGGTIGISGNITEFAGSTVGLTQNTSATTITRLSGNNNSYSGATTVTAGTLLINGNNTSTASAATVASGASIGGTGSYAGTVSVSGTLAPGDASIESLNTGAVTFNNNSTFAYELNSDTLNGDLLASSGALDLNGTVTLTLAETVAGTLDLGDKLTLISYFGAWDGGTFTYLSNTLTDGSTFTLGGNQFRFDYNDATAGTNGGAGDNFVTMTVVPEPASALLGSLGLLALLHRRRS